MPPDGNDPDSAAPVRAAALTAQPTAHSSSARAKRAPRRKPAASSIDYDGPPLAISVKAATRMSGLGPSNLYEKMQSGKLESRTVGTRRLVVYASLCKLLGLPPEAAAAVKPKPYRPLIRFGRSKPRKP